MEESQRNTRSSARRCSVATRASVAATSRGDSSNTASSSSSNTTTTTLPSKAKTARASANTTRSKEAMTTETSRRGRRKKRPSGNKECNGESKKKSVEVRFVRDDRVQAIIQDVQRLRIDNSLQDNESVSEDESVHVEFGSNKLQMSDAIDSGKAAGDSLYGFNNRNASKVKAKDKQLEVESYFTAHNTDSKTMTSNHTLDRLRTPRLTQSDLDRLLRSDDCRDKDVLLRSRQLESANFSWWHQLLRLNFSVLLYGLGSKKNLLDSFRSQALRDEDAVVIDGFFPSLTLKPLINVITEGILGKNDTEFASQKQQMSFLTEHYAKDEVNDLFLVVHNLDGTMMRSEKVQDFIATLASLPKIHLICSIDHINAGILWDQSKLSMFSFVYFDATTFRPYAEECRNERSLMVKQSGSLVLSSLVHVFASLTPNAKAIFGLIAKFQLQAIREHQQKKSGPPYKGMPFSLLYSKCSERFLVNSDLTLRTQLVEFTDHELVQVKKAAGNKGERLVIPIEVDTLQTFVDTQEDDDDDCPF